MCWFSWLDNPWCGASQQSQRPHLFPVCPAGCNAWPGDRDAAMGPGSSEAAQDDAGRAGAKGFAGFAKGGLRL